MSLSDLPSFFDRGNWCGAVLILLSILLHTGCTETDSRPPNQLQVGTAPAMRDSLTLALEMIQGMGEFEPHDQRVQISYQLNRWSDQLPAKSDWAADVLVSRIPRRVRGPHSSKTLGKLTFNLNDVHYLEQATWLRAVAVRAASEPVRPSLQAWIEQQEKRDELDQLAAADHLFTWTIRNVQLQELQPYPADAVAAPGSEVTATRLPPAPRRGIHGPGYEHLPWQTMLYGHGDAWERGRVFIQLCRQLKIPAVMLAFNDPNRNPSPYPWLVAVPLNDRLYLFDPQLGVPLPGPAPGSIATLKDFTEDPERLRSLDVGEQHRYPVEAADLRKIVALVDASPEALSRRMYEIENKLSGEQRMILTTSPSALAKLVLPHPAVANVSIWSAAFECEMYRIGLEEQIAQNPDRWREYYRTEFIFRSVHPMVSGRISFLKGNYDGDDNQLGARQFFMQARPPDRVIQAVLTDENAQARLGLAGNLPTDPQQREATLQNSLVFFAESKRNATYWLGLVQFETGNFESAIDWFDKQTLAQDPDGFWAGGARYNLARTYEALGRIEDARATLIADQSAQRHGNLLRARWLTEANASE